MGKIQSHGWFPRYENPQIFIELLLKIEQIKTPKKITSLEGTIRKKFAKDQPPKFERNKIPGKAKGGF